MKENGCYLHCAHRLSSSLGDSKVIACKAGQLVEGGLICSVVGGGESLGYVSGGAILAMELQFSTVL